MRGHLAVRTVKLRTGTICLLLGLVLAGSAPPFTGRASARQLSLPLPPGRPSLQRGRILLRAFVAAYNRRDIAGVLATLDTSSRQFFYHDCDTALESDFGTYANSLPDLRQWLRIRFAEGDRFIEKGLQIYNHNPSEHNVVGLQAMRTDRILAAQGIPTVESGGKFTLNPNGTRLEHAVMGCFPLYMHPVKNRGRTAGLAQAFIAAYNNHDATRVLQLMDDTFPASSPHHLTYADCDLATGRERTFTKPRSLNTWLRARFAGGDRLRLQHVVRAGSAAGVTLRAVRTSHLLTGRRVVRVVVQVDPAGGLIQSIHISNSGCGRG
ncbi:MAG: hypothetical protein M3Z66_03215 [Chloroflexota bacterium]|nr:hypothetical protein [Chloroflexota bacterium]